MKERDAGSWCLLRQWTSHRKAKRIKNNYYKYKYKFMYRSFNLIEIVGFTLLLVQ